MPGCSQELAEGGMKGRTGPRAEGRLDWGIAMRRGSRRGVISDTKTISHEPQVRERRQAQCKRPRMSRGRLAGGGMGTSARGGSLETCRPDMAGGRERDVRTC